VLRVSLSLGLSEGGEGLLYRMGTKVYHYGMMDLHASGHGNRGDLRKMIQLMRPEVLFPVHGYYSMMVNHASLGQGEGISEDNIIIADNGSIVHVASKASLKSSGNDRVNPVRSRPAEGTTTTTFRPKSETLASSPSRSGRPEGAVGRSASNGTNWWFDKKTAPSDMVMVDGLGVGDIGNVVLRDRQVLAEDSMFVIVVLVDARSGKVRTSPDIISRGFVYLKDNKDLLMQVRKKIRLIVEKNTTRPINWVYLKDLLRDEIGLFLFQKTERRPMILPVVIEV